MIISIKVITGAKKTAFDGWQGDAIKIRLHAQPVDNKANEALIEFLAEQFQTNKRSIKIIKGEKNRLKVIEIVDYKVNPLPDRSSPL